MHLMSLTMTLEKSGFWTGNLFLWDYLGYSVHVAYYKEKKKQRQKPSSI